MSNSLLLLPGDGIGPEIAAEARRVVEWFNKARGLNIEIGEALIGGTAYDVEGAPLSDETIGKAKKATATLLAAVGGPQWAGLSYDKRPEAGLLGLRKAMGVFANLRPALCFDALVDSSPLKPDLIRGLDIMIVRELLGGVYFGEPRGVTDLPDGQRRGVNTQVYTTSEIHRVGRVAFEIARARRASGKPGAVTSCEKSNVMESGLLWREEITKLQQAEFPDVPLSHMYTDNCAMQLCRAPKQFDVIVTDNLFGDILSDEAAMLTGSIGMLPSASLSGSGGPGLYEPVHGSAPDIAGKGVANPLAMILSFEFALRYSFNAPAEADLLRKAVEATLETGARTGDIWTKEDGGSPINTKAMGEAVIEQLSKLA